MIIAAKVNHSIDDSRRRRNYSPGCILPFYSSGGRIKSIDRTAGAGYIDEAIDQLRNGILELPGQGILPDQASRTGIQRKELVDISSEEYSAALLDDNDVFYLAAICRGHC